MPPRLVTLQRVDSTNSHAQRELSAGRAGHLDAWRAEVQEAGRGRRGARWIGQPGDTLMLSVVVRGAWPWPGALSLVAGLAVLDAVRAVGGPAPLAVDWPNDVVASGRGVGAGGEAPKVAGVLIEGRASGDGGMDFVVGVGVNVRGTLAAELRAERPVATLAELGVATTTAALGEALHAALIERVRGAEQRMDAARSAGFAAYARALCDEYRAASDIADGPVRVRLAEAVHTGTLVALAPDGLVLATAAGEERFALEHVLGIHRHAPA